MKKLVSFGSWQDDGELVIQSECLVIITRARQWSHSDLWGFVYIATFLETFTQNQLSFFFVLNLHFKQRKTFYLALLCLQKY